MYTILKSWVTSIVVVIIFLALVDMILPSGSIKKYARLVTGLIVIIVIMKPIFSIFNQNNLLENSINNYVNTYDAPISKDLGNLNRGYSSETIRIFKENLISKIEKEMSSASNKKYKVSKLSIDENQKSERFLTVKFIELRVNGIDNKIKKVTKIDLTNQKNNLVEKEETDQNDWDEKAATILVQNYGLNRSDIRFVR